MKAFVRNDTEDTLANSFSGLDTLSGTACTEDAGEPLMSVGLLRVLGYIVLDDGQHVCDYKLALIREMTAGQQSLTIGFWCLSPGVTFRSLSSEARSIIVASGTLSPLSSFYSELAAEFPNTLEANHVIAEDRAWVGVVKVGPSSDASLNGTFKVVSSFEYQDQIGEAILQTGTIVPDGILCFVTSYR